MNEIAAVGALAMTIKNSFHSDDRLKGFRLSWRVIGDNCEPRRVFVAISMPIF